MIVDDRCPRQSLRGLVDPARGKRTNVRWEEPSVTHAHTMQASERRLIHSDHLGVNPFFDDLSADGTLLQLRGTRDAHTKMPAGGQCAVYRIIEANLRGGKCWSVARPAAVAVTTGAAAMAAAEGSAEAGNGDYFSTMSIVETAPKHEHREETIINLGLASEQRSTNKQTNKK